MELSPHHKYNEEPTEDFYQKDLSSSEEVIYKGKRYRLKPLERFGKITTIFQDRIYYFKELFCKKVVFEFAGQ